MPDKNTEIRDLESLRTVTDDQIVTERKLPRRSFLSTTGALLAGAVGIVSGVRASSGHNSRQDDPEKKSDDPEKRADDPEKRADDPEKRKSDDPEKRKSEDPEKRKSDDPEKRKSEDPDKKPDPSKR